MFSRALRNSTLLYLPSIAKKGSTTYGHFTDGTEAQRLNYLPAARQNRGGIWNWLQQSYFPGKCLKHCTIFPARPTQSAQWRERPRTTVRPKLWPELCVLLSPLANCPHRNSVYFTALSQKLENNFLPLANIFFGCVAQQKKPIQLFIYCCICMLIWRSVGMYTIERKWVVNYC